MPLLRAKEKQLLSDKRPIRSLLVMIRSKKSNCVMVSKKHQKNLEAFFIKVSKNERRTYLTNFIAVSISNGHKTKTQF